MIISDGSIPLEGDLLDIFEEYELVEQDGFITTYPDLKTLLTKKESPESMEIEEGSITFEKND